MTPSTTRGPVVPVKEELPVLLEIVRLLNSDPDASAMLVSIDGREATFPDSLMQALRNVAEYLANDMAVSVTSIHRGLTIQKAANILDVPEPYLTQMLEQGEIPYHVVDTHRRIEISDLLDYKQRRDAQRREALRELTQMSQEMGLYDLPKDQS